MEEITGDLEPSATKSEVEKKCQFSLSKSESTTTTSGEINQTMILNRMPDCCLPLPKLEPTENHSIMFSPDFCPGEAPSPYPEFYVDKWDSDHVRMPYSPSNRDVEYKKSYNRWDAICKSLKSDIKSSAELEEAIMKYNSHYIGKWNFMSLHAVINNHFNTEERDHFFKTLLPAMVDMALDLPKICTQPIPLLKTGKDRYVTLSQKQIGCLLLNAFFCTFPWRTYPNTKKLLRDEWSPEYASFNRINFNVLFAGCKGDRRTSKPEKLKCLINYFKRIITEEPTGTVTFHRQVIQDKDFPDWCTSSQKIRTAVIRSSGLIESDGNGMLKVDFADEFIGGIFIGQGCLQEEVLFAIYPELLVSCLFVERFAPNEALIVTGVERYNKYSGYHNTFKWDGDFRDEIPRDSWGRKYTQIVAIDAIPFHNIDDQFELQNVKRELNKAFSGFYENGTPANLPAVATGNWGCGAFNGIPTLKFVIQLMAASEAGRNLLYFTFEDTDLETELQKITDLLNDKNLTVGDCWRLLMNNSDDEHSTRKRCDLYNFFYSQFVTKTDNSS